MYNTGTSKKSKKARENFKNRHLPKTNFWFWQVLNGMLGTVLGVVRFNGGNRV
jgi:hypothetical protein